MTRSQLFSKSVGFLVLMMLSCTEASLEGLPPPPPAEVDNKMSVSGGICMQSPEDLIFPMRVIFLVDCSESIRVTDPPDPLTGESGRVRAVREAAERLLTGEGDVKISVVRFSSGPMPLTETTDADGNLSSFTDNLDFVYTRLPLLETTDRTTNFNSALAEAYGEIRDELNAAEKESLALSSYHVIMVTDGIPDVETTEARENSAESILESIDALMELGRMFHIGKMTVNTGLISTGNAAVDLTAENLLQDMAEQGAGTYRSFASGGELNFVYVELAALKRIFTLSSLVVENINTITSKDQVLADSDGDGVADIVEIATKSNPFDPDSDGDGCRDGLEYSMRSSGMDPLDPDDCQCLVADYCFDEDENDICDCQEDGTCWVDEDGDGECDRDVPGACCVDADGDDLCDCVDVDENGICDASNYTDSDGDGLNDCEELLSGTNRGGADTDKDGLIDFMEVRFGTSPDINDTADDLDWDGVDNGEEVRTGTDPLANTHEYGRAKQAYRYKLEESASILKRGQSCYHFEVNNITLAEVIDGDDGDKVSGPGGQGFSGSNRILIFAGEVPFDDPESFARYRVACVEAKFVQEGNYKVPPDGRTTVSDAQFVPLSEFNPDVDCIAP